MSQQHQSSPAVLDRRTVANDHRRLTELLRPGLSVLDIGCGTGSITRGIAEAVQAGGAVLGLDRDEGHNARARSAASAARSLNSCRWIQVIPEVAEARFVAVSASLAGCPAERPA